jgi:hypothetical protein
VEEGKMIEVSANVPGAGSNAHVIDATGNGAHNSTKATVFGKIADDDAAAAIINNLVSAGAANNPLNSKNYLTITSIISENLLHLKQLAKKLEGRLRELGGNADGFKGSGVLERLKEQIEVFTAGGVLDNLKKEIEALKSSNSGLENLKKEIEAILAFEESLLDVHEKIDEFTKYVEFRLAQLPGNELNENLELGKFTISRMKEEALRAMRGQAHLDPERVLSFLKNAVKEETDQSTG